jgi:potassium/hydrogen antiporter
LILIVLEASLDLSLSREKTRLIVSSLSSAIVLFLIFVVLFTGMLFYIFHYDVRTSLVNIIPIAIISSAVAIPSAISLADPEREFVIYESSLSDIVGILTFNYFLFSSGSMELGILRFLWDITITIILSVLFSSALAVMLHKINHHVKHVVIMTAVVLIYALAYLMRLPSLVVVLIFGLVMNNNNLFKNSYSIKLIDFKEFNDEVCSFKSIVAELTFIVRSFFFVLFGFYINVSDLLNLNNLIVALIFTSVIFILRALFLKAVLRMPLKPLFYFAPRGLITILLFLYIPGAMLLPFMNAGVVIQVIFITILMMAFGNLIFQRVDQLTVPKSRQCQTVCAKEKDPSGSDV